MIMTHYMELLATSQPWNLILYMAIPVILAETIAITELYILFNRNCNPVIKRVNKIASIVVGIYFVGIFLNLLWTAVIPLTLHGGWRGPADVLAVGFYLLGVIPLAGMALLGLNVLKRNASEEAKLKLHVFFVALFLIVAHVAMIFGMLNPTTLGYEAPAETQMHGM